MRCRFPRACLVVCLRCSPCRCSKRARSGCDQRSIRRQVDRSDLLQGLAGLVQVCDRFGVVEAGVVQDDGNLVVVRLAYQAGQGQGDLLGVLVALDGVNASACWSGSVRRRRTGRERARSTYSLALWPQGSQMPRVSASCSSGHRRRCSSTSPGPAGRRPPGGPGSSEW